jgi:signal transduction histidine kinase
LVPPGPRVLRAAALEALADRVLESPDLADLSQLLTRDLPEVLGLSAATLLLWDRKLETFHALLPGDAWVQALRPGDGVPTPEARFLLADGVLMETPGRGEGVLMPLLARSGLIGMLVLGAPRRRRKSPVAPAHLRVLAALATRTALAIENHLYQSELIASERMAALGTMAGMLAHDFRGPMTVIRGYAEMLSQGSPSEEDVRQRAGLIVDAVDRLERMTAETLDFAREGGRVVRRQVVLSVFLEDVAREIEREFPGLQVRRAIELPAPTTASLDVDKLQRVVGNIAANARDAMGGRGRFHLGAQLDESEAAPRLVLTLADEGPGVPDEIRERLFDPFVTKGKKGGTGLGLAVARRFVEDHGGRIELLPAEKGARFQITLPIQEPSGS